ncbi:hypothetical protein Syun_018917 [Stephania yunnanensis]|uniref:SWIM-type domain-containing protein n=1 Tax=Stephania yunnanensis TaxID=152371 RepID=A0AAP0NXG4_9MAGN
MRLSHVHTWYVRPLKTEQFEEKREKGREGRREERKREEDLWRTQVWLPLSRSGRSTRSGRESATDPPPRLAGRISHRRAASSPRHSGRTAIAPVITAAAVVTTSKTASGGKQWIEEEGGCCSDSGIDGLGITRLIYKTRIAGMSPRTRKEDKMDDVEMARADLINGIFGSSDIEGSSHKSLGCKDNSVPLVDEYCKEVSYTVEYRTNGQYFDCNCRKSESSGLLCRHIFKVMKMKGIARVHERYIMRRWRKDVLRRHLSIIHSRGYPQMTDEYKKFKEIERTLHEAVDLCANNPARLVFFKT